MATLSRQGNHYFITAKNAHGTEDPICNIDGGIDYIEDAPYLLKNSPEEIRSRIHSASFLEPK